MFAEADRHLYFGFSYGFLIKIFNSISASKGDRKNELFKLTGYRRKINQLCCAMTFEEFLDVSYNLFEKGDMKYSKFSDFLNDILHRVNPLVLSYRLKEKKIYLRRKEIMSLKTQNIQQKKEVFFKILSENSDKSLEIIENTYAEKGYHLSEREKIFILEIQLNFLKQLISAKEQTWAERATKGSWRKRQKVKELKVREKELITALNSIQENYGKLFKKGIEHYF